MDSLPYEMVEVEVIYKLWTCSTMFPRFVLLLNMLVPFVNYSIPCRFHVCRIILTYYVQICKSFFHCVPTDLAQTYVYTTKIAMRNRVRGPSVLLNWMMPFFEYTWASSLRLFISFSTSSSFSATYTIWAVSSAYGFFCLFCLFQRFDGSGRSWFSVSGKGGKKRDYLKICWRTMLVCTHSSQAFWVLWRI